MRFLDLELEDPAPDATTIWLFREALAHVLAGISRPRATLRAAARSLTPRLCRCPSNAIQRRRTKRCRQDAGGMGAAARQGCPEGQGRALDKEERRELLRLQEPPRRGQGAQADPQMGCDGRIRARQSEAGRCARSLQHRQGGLGGQRLPFCAD